MEEYQKVFKDRIEHHIELVNKYANKIGHTYPHHDADKLGPLFQAYSLSKKYGQGYETYEGLPPDEAKIYNEATVKHITSNPHHPEYFANRSDRKRLDNFTRDNPPLDIDCTRMSSGGIEEMCCDWCAMSEEFGNTPLEWMEENVGLIGVDSGKRWLFRDTQIRLIKLLLERLWDND